MLRWTYTFSFCSAMNLDEMGELYDVALSATCAYFFSGLRFWVCEVGLCNTVLLKKQLNIFHFVKLWLLSAHHYWYEVLAWNGYALREDGSSEVQLGQTRVMGFVTSQLVQPYRDRPNEGSLAIYTEFSPMADPSFEVGRPGEFSVELGRIIDRGLRYALLYVVLSLQYNSVISCWHYTATSPWMARKCNSKLFVHEYMLELFCRQG